MTVYWEAWRTGNYQCYGAINAYYTAALMAVTVSSPIKMSTLQLKGDINWALNDYAEEPSQIGTKQGTSSDSSRGLKIGLKMRLIAVWKKKRRGELRWGEGEKEVGIIGCREQGALIQMTIQLIISCSIFYTFKCALKAHAWYLYAAYRRSCHLRTAHAQYEEYISNLHLGEKKL